MLKIPFKYRITAVIFTLAAVILAIVLSQSLTQYLKGSRGQLAEHEQATLKLLGEFAHIALLTTDYEIFQPQLEHVASLPGVSVILLADDRGVIVATSRPDWIGQSLSSKQINVDTGWKLLPLKNMAGSLGTLAAQFSDDALMGLHNQIRTMAIIWSLSGLLIIALISLLAGHLLTRRLAWVTRATEAVSNGDLTARAAVNGSDEVAELGRAFDFMVQKINDDRTQLEERKQYLSLTLDSIGDAVITTDALGNITRMNQVAEQLTGWTLQEACGGSVKAVFSIVDATTRNTIENPVEKVLATGEIVYLNNHTTLISKDGIEFQIADSAAPIRDEENNILGMVLVFNDVTEQYQLREARRESEDRFRQLAENINEVFWLGSPSWDEIFYISPAYEKIWGHKSEDLYLNPRLWIESVHPDDRKQVIDDIPKDINSIGDYVDFKEYRIQKPDGQILWIKARAYPIYDDDGQVIRIAGTAENITEQVNMEETFRRTKKMDALGKLTGGIAHDYNNMLGIILGYTDMLKHKLSNQFKDQPELEKYIHEIHHASERGEKLTRKLLSFSRQKTSDAKSLNINSLLQDQQHMLEKTLTARIKLVLDLENDLWPVLLDNSDLEDAIVNLSINAMHAIDGNGQLTIQTRNVFINEKDVKQFQIKPGDYVQLSLNDTGSGMDKITKERIFEPFFSTKGDKGTGLGLSQVYGFAQRSGGAINVYSEPDHGTRIILYFPRCQPAGSNVKSAIENTIEDFRGHENILIVDDEPALLDLNREILEHQGYHTVCVQSAKQALEILENKSFELLLSDVIMPETDGYQLAEAVQKKYPTMKIQLVSGFTDDRHINMDNNSIHSNLIYKPYRAITLLKRIRDLLDNK